MDEFRLMPIYVIFQCEAHHVPKSAGGKSIIPLRGCLKSRLRVTDHRRVMPTTINTDKLYDTDLTDAAWALIAPMLPAARRGGRPRTTNIRAVLNAIFYLLRTGCQWRLLPREFPVWRTFTPSGS